MNSESEMKTSSRRRGGMAEICQRSDSISVTFPLIWILKCALKEKLQQLLSYWCGQSSRQPSVWERFSFLLSLLHLDDISGPWTLRGGWMFLSGHNNKYFCGGRPAGSSPAAAAGLNPFLPTAILRLTANTSNGVLRTSRRSWFEMKYCSRLLSWSHQGAESGKVIVRSICQWQVSITRVAAAARASALSQSKHRFLFLAVNSWRVSFSLLNNNQRFSKETQKRETAGIDVNQERSGTKMKLN